MVNNEPKIYKEVKGAFRTVSPIVREEDRLLRSKRADIGDFKEATFGEGSNVFRVSSDGLWLGAETYGGAPFRIDMEGNMYLISAQTGGYIMINASRSEIIVNDGSNDLVVIGDL